MKNFLIVSFFAAFISNVAVQANAVVVNIFQDGDDVVANYSGSLNTAGLQFLNSHSSTNSSLDPSFSFITNLQGPWDRYRADITLSFGTGSTVSPTSSQGDTFGFVSGFDEIYLPSGYSGGQLSGSLTFESEDLDSLGIDLGNYSINLPNDLIEINVLAPIPLPASFWLLGAACLGLGFRAHRTKRNV
ncbi:VPLPA-CTERM sorting domain-containing protein [uncultured Ruegeria sp.]|uniref:VPLPA-CTERM sorting domain-containing protein n=1 Tax=uncultured Ruegeria sp. TaxID=259304 RepID=UPI00261EED3F|nr:VPLPA-CTERM sorting domain-containing protein [uncultured Ruegeria sp.]